MNARGAMPFIKGVALPSAIPLGTILTVSIVDSFFRDWDLFLVLAGLFILAVWALAMVVIALRKLWERDWQVNAQLLSAVAVSCLLAQPLYRMGDYVHLAVMYPFYATQINAVHGARVLFDWGVDGFVGMSTEYTLIYDPAGMQTNGNVRHLAGRFYLRAVTS